MSFFNDEIPMADESQTLETPVEETEETEDADDAETEAPEMSEVPADDASI